MVHQSGETELHGSTSKKGPGAVRWALVQAARVAVRCEEYFGSFYTRLKRKKNDQISIVATARKMLVSMFYMLKRNEPFDPPEVSTYGATQRQLLSAPTHSHSSARRVPRLPVVSPVVVGCCPVVLSLFTEESNPSKHLLSKTWVVAPAGFSYEELDRLLNETDDVNVHERLVFIKRLYKGATLAEAADDVGKSKGTAGNWVERWNDGGLGQLTPNFGGGQPPKLDEDQQDELIDRLREGQPWKKQEIQHLLNEDFDVEFHPNYLPSVLSDLGLSYAIPRTKRPDRPDNAEEILDERVAYAFDEGDTDVLC